MSDGTRSRHGCEQCRAAKRKCSEQKPCERCVARRITCSGPRAHFRFVVPSHERDRTVAAIRATSGVLGLREDVVDPRRPTTRPNLTSINLCDIAPFSVAKPHFTWHNVVRSSYIPRACLEANTAGSIKPWTALIGGSSPSPSLEAAMFALSLQDIARGKTVPASMVDLRVQARHQYGRALIGVRQILDSGTKRITDDLTLTIMILASFEFRDNSVEAFTAHMCGLTRMLKLRGASQVQGPEPQKLFATLRDRLIMWATFSCTELPFDTVHHSWFFSSPPSTPWERLQRITARFPDIRFRSRVLLSKQQPHPHTTDILYSDTAQMLLELRDWDIKESRRRSGSGAGMSDRFDPSLSMMLRWFMACEILCLDIMQKCMAIMIAREVDSNQAAQMRTNRQAFLDEAVKSCATMCDSVSAYKRDGGILLENGTPVPYRVLVSTAYMLQPITLPTLTDCITANQKRWLMDQILQISGAAQALQAKAMSNFEQSVDSMKGSNPEYLDVLTWAGEFAD